MLYYSLGYNGENHMVLGDEPEDRRIQAKAYICVITDPVNIGRWQGYKKWDEDICLDDNYYTFKTIVEVECLSEVDWDDDFGAIEVPEVADLWSEVSVLVREIDPSADYEAIDFGLY